MDGSCPLAKEAKSGMKRFTETAKWRDPWFQCLSHGSKLLFIYICDNCDNAGFYEINEPELCFHLGIDKSKFEGALKGLQRGIKGPCDGWLWVKRFLRHQKNESINPENPAHKQIIALFKSQHPRFSADCDFNDFVAPYKGLLSPIGIGKGEGKGKKGSVRGNKFEPPTLEEWLAQADTIGYPAGDAEQAYHHYSAKGWRVGKEKMEVWRSAIQTCFSRWKQHGSSFNGKEPEPDWIKCADGVTRLRGNCRQNANGAWELKS